MVFVTTASEVVNDRVPVYLNVAGYIQKQRLAHGFLKSMGTPRDFSRVNEFPE
jgi:hypothetical protein